MLLILFSFHNKLGDFTRSDDDEEKSSVTYAIRQYRFFQQYTGDVVNGWDVVILETKTEIHLDKYRKIFATICEDDDRMRPVRAIGMGLTDSEKATRPHTLMVILRKKKEKKMILKVAEAFSYKV